MVKKVNVKGTRYTFPTEQRQLEMFTRIHGRNPSEVVKAAEKARPVKTYYTLPRPPVAPKPGNGVFNPKHGAPGSTLRVTVVDQDHLHPSIEVEGCVMFPAPGGHLWVSLWDGKMPVKVYPSGGKPEVRVESDRIVGLSDQHHTK